MEKETLGRSSLVRLVAVKRLVMELNNLAKRALDCAYKRKKLSRLNSVKDLCNYQMFAMALEIQEFGEATGREIPSPHLPDYSEKQEEAADIIISTMVYLYLTGVDVDKLIEDKMRFNETREG